MFAMSDTTVRIKALPHSNNDILTLGYRAHEHAVTVLMQHFTGDPSQTRVLDVACGSGLVAKTMVELGFGQFVGVDASEGMLKEAELTGLYQDLHHAILGTQALSVEREWFDVVTVVGGLYPGFIPVSAVREFYEATKPGGLVCMSRGNYPRPEYISYDEALEETLAEMETEGLWTRLTATKVQRYVADHLCEEEDPDRREYIPGTIYVFKKSQPRSH
uniref:Methyltransferase domain-containing protein n=1 Tax=Neogobius melanostomus TaxID=47308 RepID=A0A8C6TCF7_9GOBI